MSHSSETFIKIEATFDISNIQFDNIYLNKTNSALFYIPVTNNIILSSANTTISFTNVSVTNSVLENVVAFERVNTDHYYSGEIYLDGITVNNVTGGGIAVILINAEIYNINITNCTFSAIIFDNYISNYGGIYFLIIIHIFKKKV